MTLTFSLTTQAAREVTEHLNCAQQWSRHCWSHDALPTEYRPISYAACRPVSCVGCGSASWLDTLKITSQRLICQFCRRLKIAFMVTRCHAGRTPFPSLNRDVINEWSLALPSTPEWKRPTTLACGRELWRLSQEDRLIRVTCTV